MAPMILALAYAIEAQSPPPPSPSPPPPTPVAFTCPPDAPVECRTPNGNVCLRAILPSECPTGISFASMPQCHLGYVPIGGFCEADSECGTQNVNNWSDPL